MDLTPVMEPESRLPEAFVLPTDILIPPVGSMPAEDKGRLLNRIADATEAVVGENPASVHYVGSPFVSFGTGRWTQRTWFQGDSESGTFRRIDAPILNPHRVIPVR